MNVLLDSNILIGLWHHTDQYREKSIQIIKNLSDEKIKKIYLTNYVVVEVVNFLLKKVSFEQVAEALRYLLTTEKIEITYVDKFLEKKMLVYFHRYKCFSWTDCSLLTIAQEKGISCLYSFDKDFDIVKELERKEEP